MNGGKIRIKDIAQMAGVSKGTVDRVLHNRGRVSAEALRKVMKVLEEIDYTPNLLARTLSSNKTYRIAALLPDPTHDQYWNQSTLGIQAARKEWAYYNFDIDVYTFDQYNKESFKSVAQEALASDPDGILTAPIFYNEALAFFDHVRQRKIPYVLFNTNIPEVQPLCFIGQDAYRSGAVGAELMYLGQTGSGKIAVLHLDEDFHNSVHLLEKERGFRAYFQNRNTLHFDIQEFSFRPDEPDLQARLSAVIQDDSLRGIFVSTSKGTSVVAAILQQIGKNNVRFIGYDLLEDNLKYLRDGTIDFLINQNPKRQTFLGVSYLGNNIVFKKPAPKEDLFPLEVITQQNLDSYLKSQLH